MLNGVEKKTTKTEKSLNKLSTSFIEIFLKNSENIQQFHDHKGNDLKGHRLRFLLSEKLGKCEW